MTTLERLKKAKSDAEAGQYDTSNHMVRGIGKTAIGKTAVEPELLVALTILGLQRRLDLYTQEHDDCDYAFTSYLDHRTSTMYYVATSWCNNGPLLTVVAHEDDWSDTEAVLRNRDMTTLLQVPGDMFMCRSEVV